MPTLEQRVATLETYLKVMSGGIGITLAGVAALAFWFGSLKTTVEGSTIKTDKVYEIVLENKDSLATRTGVIESKLDSIDKKLTDMAVPQRQPQPRGR